MSDESVRHEVAKGRTSGAVVETDTGTVNTVRDGKIVRVRSYTWTAPKRSTRRV